MRSKHDRGSCTQDESDKVRVVDNDGRPFQVVRYSRLDESPFARSIHEELQAAGFESPTPIQSYAWPLALRGHDIIGLAETGSGKTLAFLLPAFQRLMNTGKLDKAVVMLLVLVPTRELACQIEEQASRFGARSNIRTCSIYGGVPRHQQLQALRTRKPQCIVACPGRLLDLLRWGQINLSNVSVLAIDEADRLLDMGFEPQVREVLTYLVEKDRQSLLFTATWPAEVHALADDITQPSRAVHVQLQKTCELRANECVHQIVRVLPNVQAKQRMVLDLLRHLRESRSSSVGETLDTTSDRKIELWDKVLIFCSRRDNCEILYEVIEQAEVPAAVIHAEYSQGLREQALRDFRSGAVRVLVATDLAARGLDIEGVTIVVNFEPPQSSQVQDYVHRIGRTGRAGLRGRAITLLTPHDTNQARVILDVMRNSNQTPPRELEELAAQARGTAKERRHQKRQQYIAKLGRWRVPVQYAKYLQRCVDWFTGTFLGVPIMVLEACPRRVLAAGRAPQH